MILRLILAIFLVASPLALPNVALSRIINGEVVPPEHYREVVEITSSAGNCSGTIVGEQALLLAAHCVPTNSPLLQIKHMGESFNAIALKSPLYQERDHDIAVAKIMGRIPNATYAIVSGTPGVGEHVHILGYGCTSPAEPNYGSLTLGSTVVKFIQNLDFIGRGPQTLCFGDAGGPALVDQSYPASRLVVGIASKSDLKDTSYFVRLDSSESLEFFKRAVETFDIQICGFSEPCP